MAKMKLNKKLNLVFPIEVESGVAYVHSMSVSREVFEMNYLVLSMTFMEIYGKRLGPIMGPRVAYYLLRDQALSLTPKPENNQSIDPDEDVWGKTQKTLIQEIYRLTTIIVPTEDKYDTIPYIQAKQQKILDEDQIMEVENAIVYFTVASHLHQKSELSMAYAGLERTYNAQTVSLNVTEYMNSLPTLTKEENTGETTQAQEPRVLRKVF